MHVPIDQRASKTKIIGLPDLEAKIWTMVRAQQVTLSFSPIC